MYDRNIQIGLPEIEAGLIPSFLVEKWQEKHGGRNPVDVYKREMLKPTRLDKAQPYLWIALTVSLIIAMLGSYRLKGSLVENGIKHLDITLIVIGLIGMIGVLRVFLSFPNERVERTGEGHDFFNKLRELYIYFDIEVCTDIGKLSYVEFRSCIEGELKSAAKDTEEAVGFDKHRQRTMFHEKHRIALEWGLCRENYVHYFPSDR